MTITTKLENITKEVAYQRGILVEANRKFQRKQCPNCNSTRLEPRPNGATFCTKCKFLHIPGKHPLKFDTYREKETD